MRFWQILGLISLAWIFSACSGAVSSLDGVDRNIPQVKNIKTISDVSSIAFEWDVLNDPSIRGYALYRDDGDGYKEVAYIKIRSQAIMWIQGFCQKKIIVIIFIH